MSAQAILTDFREIKKILIKHNIKKFMLVGGKTLSRLPIMDYIKSMEIPFIKFSDYTPNPTYMEAKEGTELFRTHGCEAVVAVGGGSALDVAKCIKLFATMSPCQDFFTQEYKENNIPLIAVPTTAGTGSESTQYAVIYYEGRKQSVTHPSIVPGYAVLEPSVLKGSPAYLKKCAVLDALCQSIEAWWSINSTAQSIEYSKKSFNLILPALESYLEDNDAANADILLGANYSGRAINIARTAAPHTLSYNLTRDHNLAHGHAVAICLPKIWRYMLLHSDKCVDPRGSDYLAEMFDSLSNALGMASPIASIEWFEALLYRLDIKAPVLKNEAEAKASVEKLAKGVNLQRLANNPVALDLPALEEIYSNIFNLK